MSSLNSLGMIEAQNDEKAISFLTGESFDHFRFSWINDS